MSETMPVSRNLNGMEKRYRHSASGGNNQIWRRWWSQTSPRTRVSLQVGLLVLVVAIAYNYSLTTLLQSANQDTPLAYVSLVPAIALALAAIRARPAKPEPDIHDRHVDYTVGLPLIAAAISVNVLLPSRWSTMFWVYRVDLFTLPFFVAGAVAIIFGVRIMWRQKLAIAYLFLAWPYPYQSVLLRVLDAFTAATLFGIRMILTVIHVATPVSSLDNSLFNVVHDGHSFPLSVVSACSGVNSVVGFLLVGSAFGAVVRGPLFRKVAWLLGGMMLLWVINLGRIIFIFWAGRTWGEDVAINILHPFVGMVTFSIGVVFMVLLIGPMGMHVGFGQSTMGARTTPAASSARRTASIAVPKVYLMTVIALIAGLVLGAANLGLRSYNLVANASGEPRLTAFVNQPIVPTGWTVQLSTTYDWAKPLFGYQSVWNRYVMYPTVGGNLHANLPVIADVINTPDLSTFSAYGIEDCYQFHGYTLADVAQISCRVGLRDSPCPMYPSSSAAGPSSTGSCR
jgi:exosortase/archaeosortase family protein